MYYMDLINVKCAIYLLFCVKNLCFRVSLIQFSGTIN